MKLVAENLVVLRGGRPVLDGVGFAAQAGGALAVVGPNGSGKSTLLRTLAGLLKPLSGEVHIEGDGDHEPRERMHLLGHLDAVKSGLTVARNLVFARDLLGGEGDIDAALARVGLGRLADLPGGVLSAGQRRRLALARLIAAPRPIWLLDEPTAALDASGQALLSELVAEHRAKGGWWSPPPTSILAFPTPRRSISASAPLRGERATAAVKTASSPGVIGADRPAARSRVIAGHDVSQTAGPHYSGMTINC